jgi:type IV pilus assembly protein PilX
MNIEYRSRAIACNARHQRGVVLFIALIAMVVMSLAGVALIRAVGTSGSVAGNLAFRELANAPVSYAIERSVNALFGATPTVTNRTANLASQGYFASLQPGELANGAPAMLGGAYPPSSYTGPVDIDPATKAETRAVIERLCNAAGLPTINNCDELPPKVSLGKTTMKLKNPTLPPIPLYRITVRVDLPGTNSVSYAQAMIME